MVKSVYTTGEVAAICKVSQQTGYSLFRQWQVARVPAYPVRGSEEYRATISSPS